jgi:cobalt-zinc-cadmium efflux system membrane fusion protein
MRDGLARGRGRGLISWVLAALMASAGCDRGGASAEGAGHAGRAEGADGGGAPRVVLRGSAVRLGRIETERVQMSARGPRLGLPATIEADPTQVARVGARVSGRVSALRVRVGQPVAAGDPLVEVDTVELHQVSTEYLVAQARLRQARDALARARGLSAEGVGATQDLRRAEADERVAAATLHEAEEHLHFLGLREREIQRVQARSSHGGVRAIVRAPIAGRVASMGVALGQVLGGTETVAVVGDPSRVWVVARVFQSQLGRVRVGSAMTVRVEGADEPRAATVESVSDVLDPDTRTATARASLGDGDGALRDGMSATAWVQTEGESALWVDEACVIERDGARGVFVRVGPGTYELRTVELREGEGDRVAIARGVTVGEEIVTRGAFLLAGELDRAARSEED